MYTRLDLLLAMGIAWVISGIIQIRENRELKGAPKYSAFFIIGALGVTLLDNLIRPSMSSPILLKMLLNMSRNAYLLIGPGLWFYCRSLLNPLEKRKAFELLHLLPFVLWFLWSILKPGPPDQTGPQPLLLRGLLSLLSRLIYSLFCLRILLKQRKSAADYYSRLTSRNTLSWLFYLLVFYSFFFLLGSIISVIPEPSLQKTIGITVRIIPSVLFIFFFSHFASDQRILEDRKEETSREPDQKDTEKYKTSGLGPDESSGLYNELNIYLKSSRIYLDPEITLINLAEKMGMSRHHLSEIINREARENFYGLINSYRLEAFMGAVEENLYPNYTILATAMECGFKSSSAFYSFFKKEKGMTPKQYMKMV